MVARVPLFVLWSALGGLAHAQSQPPRAFEHPEPAAAGRRLALVVGIDSYPRSPLLNARNDARAMAETLRDLGFTVTLLEDASRNQMVTTLATFSDMLRPDDVGFLFYAGHGLQIDGENYLVPADFDATSATAARLGTLPVGELQAALSRARVSVLVLDACRNNPFASTRGGRGLAAMEARGSLVAFATGAGQTASDNPAAGNGLFTQKLLTTLREPNLPLRDVFYRVRQRVYDATNGQQFPALYDGLLGDVVLRPGPGTMPSLAASAVSAAPVPVSAGAPPPAVVMPAVQSPSTSFALEHQTGAIVIKEVHPGQLTAAGGRVQWAEAQQVGVRPPKLHEKIKYTANAAVDDFNVACTGIERAKEYYGMVEVRTDKRTYRFFLPTGSMEGKSDDEVVRTARAIAAHIRAACPGVKD
jgi:hypothetical protein